MMIIYSDRHILTLNTNIFDFDLVHFFLYCADAMNLFMHNLHDRIRLLRKSASETITTHETTNEKKSIR